MNPHHNNVLISEIPLPEGYPPQKCENGLEPATYFWCDSFFCKRHLDEAKYRLSVALGLADTRDDHPLKRKV
jgi:hypothetical protein